jgi:hypothetical protein
MAETMDLTSRSINGRLVGTDLVEKQEDYVASAGYGGDT